LLCVKELWLRLIVVFLLEGTEEVVCGILGSLDLLHLLPDLLDIEVHDLILVLHVEARAGIATSLDMPGRKRTLLRDSFLLLDLN
jgi:hypothetical protein